MNRKQQQKFEEAARELGCSDSPEAFDKAIKKIAKAPPPESVAKRKVKHASDCAVHDAPAMTPGPCTCGAAKAEK